MIYNQPTFSNGIPMPLLMAYMTATAIQEAGSEPPVMYDPVSQTTRYDARVIGTYSLKISETRKGGKSVGTDRKNAIDDQKIVK
jgi:hypothetical protein